VTPLLEVRDVRKIFRGSRFDRASETIALDGVSLSVPGDRPSITGIVGESGSGKTTLARLLLGIVEPTEGQVLYEGKDLAAMSARERREFRRNVQPIFQDPFEVFNPFYRIDHVLAMPVRRFNLADSKQEERRLIVEALEAVGLRPSETLGRFPHELSGGQRQRVMVARALLLRPRLILADEPVSMLDASLRASILDSLQRLNRELSISVVYITHDLTTAYQICENVAVFYRGSIVEAGSAESVIRSPKHPYTQLLVSSIPLPDPRRRWSDDAAEADAQRATDGCRFAPRCRSAHDPCWTTQPPLYLPDPHRAAACFLYKADPVLDRADVTEVFEPRDDDGVVALRERAAVAPISLQDRRIERSK
jgi:oligopeptide/dipeptide ABC transporter ATP-binding protein